MKQSIRLNIPVRKDDGSGDLIEVGDTAHLILNDLSTKDVTVTEVSSDGKTIAWSLTSDGIPRVEDVRGVDGSHQVAVADTNTHDDPYDQDNNPRVPLS